MSAGEKLHLIGANGSGKSTLLMLLSGLLEGQGAIHYDGAPITSLSHSELARQRALLTQQTRPPFSMAVFQYLQLALSPIGKVDPELLNNAVNDITTYLSIDDKLNRPIEHLSGGEWQRVRIAAACLQVWPSVNPDGRVLLLDEPGAALDIGQESLLYKLVDRMAVEGVTVIIANHDLNRTLAEADTVIILRQGHVVAKGKPREVMTTEVLEEAYSTRLMRIEADGHHLIVAR